MLSLSPPIFLQLFYLGLHPSNSVTALINKSECRLRCHCHGQNPYLSLPTPQICSARSLVGVVRASWVRGHRCPTAPSLFVPSSAVSQDAVRTPAALVLVISLTLGGRLSELFGLLVNTATWKAGLESVSSVCVLYLNWLLGCSWCDGGRLRWGKMHILAVVGKNVYMEHRKCCYKGWP